MMNKYCKYVNILRSLKCGNFQILHIFEQSFVSKCIKLSCQRFHVIPFFSSSDQHTFIIRFSDPKSGRSLQVHLINHTFLLVNSFLRFFCRVYGTTNHSNAASFVREGIFYTSGISYTGIKGLFELP